MRESVPVSVVVDWLQRFSAKAAEHKAWLTELDSAIGDADHGANLTRGMTAVLAKLSEAVPATYDELFKTVGMTLVTTVGGASGPLYGTFFLRIGMSAGAVTQLDPAGFAAALRAGLEGLVARGKAEAGEKTMFDAVSPALDAFDTSLAAGGDLATAARAASDAAAAGRDATEPWVAKKGRASYLGERSAGHLDPGAASSALLFEALAEALAP